MKSRKLLVALLVLSALFGFAVNVPATDTITDKTLPLTNSTPATFTKDADADDKNTFCKEDGDKYPYNDSENTDSECHPDTVRMHPAS